MLADIILVLCSLAGLWRLFKWLDEIESEFDVLYELPKNKMGAFDLTSPSKHIIVFCVTFICIVVDVAYIVYRTHTYYPIMYNVFLGIFGSDLLLFWISSTNLRSTHFTRELMRRHSIIQAQKKYPTLDCGNMYELCHSYDLPIFPLTCIEKLAKPHHYEGGKTQNMIIDELVKEWPQIEILKQKSVLY
jgi:hypothetical protein